MAPFLEPQTILTGFKERAEAVAVQGMIHVMRRMTSLMGAAGDRLYVGTATGNLHVYALDCSTRTSFYRCI